MPRVLRADSELSVLTHVRCPMCGRMVQSHATRFFFLTRQGMATDVALRRCGVPTKGPFLTQAEEGFGQTPPPSCCYASIYTAIDYSDANIDYQRKIKWAEARLLSSMAPKAMAPVFAPTAPVTATSMASSATAHPATAPNAPASASHTNATATAHTASLPNAFAAANTTNTSSHSTLTFGTFASFNASTLNAHSLTNA